MVYTVSKQISIALKGCAIFLFFFSFFSFKKIFVRDRYLLFLIFGVFMSEISCSNCYFLASRSDSGYGTRKYVCHHKKTFGRYVTLGKFSNPYELIDKNVPSWCPVLKSEFNIVGTLEHICNALTRSNTIIDFGVLEHTEIKYIGELSKFIDKDWHYKAWKIYDVILLKCDFRLIDDRFYNYVTIKITSKCTE